MDVQILSSQHQHAKEGYLEQVIALLQKFSFALYLDAQTIQREWFATTNNKTLREQEVYSLKNWVPFLKDYGYYPLDGHIIHRNQDQIVDDYYEWLTTKRKPKTVANMYDDPVAGGFDVWLKEVVRCVVLVRYGEVKFSQDTLVDPTFVDAQARDLLREGNKIYHYTINKIKRLNARQTRLVVQQPADEAAIKAATRVEIHDVYEWGKRTLGKAINRHPLVRSAIPQSLLPQNLPRVMP